MIKPLLLTLALVSCSLKGLHAEHVILISSDGTRPDAITALGAQGAPNFYRLRAEGAFTDNARTDKAFTNTLPNHTGMITGRGVVGPDGHRWVQNGNPPEGMTLHKNRMKYIASVFDVAHDHGLRTGLFASKSKFELYDFSYGEKSGSQDEVGDDNGTDKIDTYVVESDTEELVDAFTAQMKEKPFDLAMLHLRDPDSAGHANTWDIADMDSGYLEAIRRIDMLLGEVLAMVDETPDLKGKTWIVLTADHGGPTGEKGHNDANKQQNYTIPFYVWGPGVERGKDLYELNPQSRKAPGSENPEYSVSPQPIRNGGAGNLALSLLGLPAIPDSFINSDQDLTVK